MSTIEDSNATVMLKSMPDEKGDVKTFKMAFKAAELSEFIKDTAGEAVDDADDTPVEIEVTRVGGDCLAKVVDFLNHYHEEPMKEIPTPLGGSSFNEVRCFCTTNRSELRKATGKGILA